MVTVIKCSECGRLATKDLQWVKKEDGKEEELFCVCGNKEWKFVEKHPDWIGPDVLVLNR